MKQAVVTGANSEIGFTICKYLLNNNYKVIACVHNNVDRIKTLESANLLIKKIDLTKENEIETLNGETIDLIINAAAYYYDDDFQAIKKEDFMRTLDVNVVAPLMLAKLIKKGVIINISSTDGIDTYNELNITYAVSKAALNHLTKSLDYAMPDVKVYALALGWVNTEMIRSINQDYLVSEMKRTKQNRLVELQEITKYIDKILIGEYKTGEIIRVEGE